MRELAELERELELVSISAEQLARDGFGDQPRFRALTAEWDGEPAGYALFFGSYSTWFGRGPFLENLFLRQALRGRGVGQALLASVGRIAVEDGCYGVHGEVSTGTSAPSKCIKHWVQSFANAGGGGC